MSTVHSNAYDATKCYDGSLGDSSKFRKSTMHAVVLICVRYVSL